MRKNRVFSRPNALKLLALLLLGGAGGCANPEPPGSPKPEAAAAASGATFVDVTDPAGLGDFVHETGAVGQEWFPETVGAGAGFIDYDGDGWTDILLVGGGVWSQRGSEGVPALRLYRNNGDGTFSERTDEAGLGDVRAYGFGITAADYDNDGDEDVFLTALHENLLFRNGPAPEGGARSGFFTEVGREAGIADHAAWSTSALFFDADRDGWLDLYVGNYVDWSPQNDIWCTMDGETKAYCTPQAYSGVPGRFYRGNGDGTFSEATDEAGLGEAPGKTLGVAEWDFNTDGWPDLVVANDTQRDLLYENNGDGTFTEKGVLAGIAFDERGRARAGMGIDVGDVDNDGQASIVIGHFSNEMVGLYRHIGNGLFADRAAVSRVGRPSLLTLTFGLFLFDADLDGWLDLFLANGHIADDVERVQDGIGYRQRAQLFLNRQNGTFEEATAHAGPAFQEPIIARGAAYADYDRDGDLDVLITENGGKVRLWRNDLGARSFLRVTLEGRESNRDGIGAGLTAKVGDLSIERRVRTGSSYLSQSEKAVTLGLGAATAVDSLIIRWPSGQVDRLAGVRAGRQIHLVEGAGAAEPLASATRGRAASR